jgi:phage terminase large subunit-like protein
MSPMMQMKLHDDRVIWPEHRSLEQTLELQETTPDFIFQTTYQGHAIQPSGSIFKREWWNGKNRFDPVSYQYVSRWISYDTASSEDENNAFTAWVVFDLLPDYRLVVPHAGRDHIEFPDLIGNIVSVSTSWKVNLKNVIIENKSSGMPAIQTLRKSAPDWLRPYIKDYNPKVDKPTRWNQAALWCKLGCVLLPEPGSSVEWLYDFEEEIFTVPNAAFKDYADAFSQGILFLELLLEQGLKSRREHGKAEK